MTQTRQTSELNRLMHALDFDNEDLHANRDGYMTKRQRARLSRRRRNVGLMFAVVTLVTGAILLVMLRLLITRLPGLIVTVPVMIGGVVVMVSVYVWFQRTVMALAADLHKGHVSAIEGAVETRRHTTYTGRTLYSTHSLYVDNVQFDIGMQVFVALHPTHDTPYIVYYAPNSRTILSMEPLEDNLV